MYVYTYTYTSFSLCLTTPPPLPEPRARPRPGILEGGLARLPPPPPIMGGESFPFGLALHTYTYIPPVRYPVQELLAQSRLGIPEGSLERLRCNERGLVPVYMNSIHIHMFPCVLNGTVRA